jgi:hypothetical protein
MKTKHTGSAQKLTEGFLTGQMLEALKTVEYRLPRFDTKAVKLAMKDAACARVEFRHVRDASDCVYLVQAFDDELLMQLQLNVWRLVVVYRVPAANALDAAGLQARLERWQRGAEHAGWVIGWRDALDPTNAGQRFVETYCYATAERDFLTNELQQLYWRTDVVQMTRYFILEIHRCGVRLSPRAAGFTV